MMSFFVFGCSFQQPAPLWPTEGWKTSTPEKQGMDSNLFAMMLEVSQKLHYPVHSILVVRHGTLVAEVYFPPYDKDAKQALNEITGAITSTLVGIAIGKGILHDIHDPVLASFPEKNVTDVGNKKRAITVENLLTMTSGLDWPGEFFIDRPPTVSSATQFETSKDWIKFVLDRPMDSVPGTAWNYNSLNTHVVSGVLQKKTSKTSLEFGEETLFKPLGIAGVTWAEDSNRVNVGGLGLRMTARDAAKIGYLYLHQGNWEGRQIVPADWVKTATSKLFEVKSSGMELLHEGYGYDWWVQPSGSYSAWGKRGQRIFVVPQQDLVFVMTGDFGSAYSVVYQEFLRSYILSSIANAETLPENPIATERLNSIVREIDRDRLEPLSALPEIVKKLEGRTFQLGANSFGFRTLGLSFRKSDALLKIDRKGQSFELAVGLDNVYRTTEFVSLRDSDIVGPVALRGHWVDDHSFELEFNSLVDGQTTMMSLGFQGNTLDIWTKSTEEHELFQGKAQN